ncbi:MAG: nuclease [Bacteriovoracaceae bacterium]|nr:nuclease [Bacteriovoracaceae bacterium]
MHGCTKLLMLVLLIVFTSTSWASLNSNYYPQLLVNKINKNKLKNIELKANLFKLLSYYHVKESQAKDKLSKTCPEAKECYKQKSNLSYRQAREYLFGQLFLKKTSKGYYVKDLYCEKKVTQADGVGPKQIPNSKKMNCEHTWPQSRFSNSFPKLLQKNDLHHLFPVDNRANSSRSNHIFAKVEGQVINNTCTTSYRGRAIGSTITAFEPPTSHQGNVARALFYFSVRYKINIDPLEEEFLRDWHIQDPVDSSERSRNTQIYKIQGNRNPFIDRPDLVNDINDF